MLIKFFKKRHKKWYQNNRWHFALDISLSILILIMLTVLISLLLFNPRINTSNPFLTPKTPPNDEAEIIEDPLQVETSINKQIINENEEISVNVKLINTAENKIENIDFELTSKSADFSLSNNTFFLEEISESDTVELILNPIIHLKNSLNRQLNLNLRLTFSYLNEAFIQEIPLEQLLYNSQVKVQATAYYHNNRGDQLGLGPIPPIVGIPTSYYVFFEIDNIGNDLSNFVLSATLADNVELTKNFSLLAGNYDYNKDNSRIVWQVNTIDKRGGNYQAAFELKITPREENIGKNLDLISNIVYNYQDSLTKKQITGSLAKIDNSLPFDFINKNQGIVRE
jgi:hypothetical protein